MFQYQVKLEKIRGKLRENSGNFEVDSLWVPCIRDEQTLSNTQQENWLLPTEPLHVARPRQTGRERPPVIDNPALRDAAGNTAVWNPSRTFLLSPGRRILMEEEVFTPPRGGRTAPEPQGVPREVGAIPKPFPDGFPEDSLRDGGQCQKNIGSPVDMLVDTVSRMQKDLAILREENRVLRTPATSQVIQAPPAGGAHDDESAAVRRNY